MLAVSPLRSSNGTDERDVGFSSSAAADSFSDINFDDLFMGFSNDGDILPDLEIDPDEIFAEFSFSGGEDSAGSGGQEKASQPPESTEAREERDLSQGEVVSGRTEEDGTVASGSLSASPVGSRGKKSAKGSQGKRKVKVDWTPELHRRFVQAVEQLGVDKAVPSRILELMGIDCLTRHNIASHLQKFRSHRKHLLAREAEAASWSQRRQMYAGRGGCGTKRGNMSHPWLAPTTLGFPPPPPPPIQPSFRPLHVWGHPTVVDRPPLVPLWPRHPSPPPRSLSTPWAVAPSLGPSFWHPHYQMGPNTLTHGMPFFPHQPLPTTRFPAPPVPGIPPHPLYRPPPTPHCTEVNPPSAPSSKHSGSLQLQLDAAHPSNESIDSVIGDVLAKPWLPLPLGLKPPSMESVMVELQKQGVSKLPPTCG